MDDPAAQLLAAQAPALMRLAYVLAGSRQDAEDICQAALLRAWRHQSRVLRAENQSAYLRRILINEFRRSKSRSSPQIALEDCAESDSGLMRVEVRSEADHLLSRLPTRRREALALRYLEDLDYDEIASILRCRQSTARSLVKRGLDQLRVLECQDNPVDGQDDDRRRSRAHGAKPPSGRGPTRP